MPDRPILSTLDSEQAVDSPIREASSLASHLQGLAEKEKAEIARTLHDELGGLLTAAKMDLSWLQSRVPAPELQERLAQLGGVLDEAMDLKRRLVDDLRPSLLDHFGLPTALRTFVDAACKKAGLQVHIELAEGNGVAVIRQARQLYPPDGQPLIVVLTNYASDFVRDHCFAAGADYFLDKMRDIALLKAIVADGQSKWTPPRSSH